jgi:hypothetical protein
MKQFEELVWEATTVEAARLLTTGLVFWRPSGVISETPDSDACLVKQG